MKEKKFKLSTLIEEVFLGVCTIIIMVPVYYFVISAFKKRTDIVKHPLVINGEMFTLSNFPAMIKKMQFWEALRNTTIITVVPLLFVVVLASIAGFAIARIGGKFLKTYYKGLVALMVIPYIGCLLPLVVLSTKINTYNSLWACILIQAAWNMPFATFLYAGFMQTIPKELEEAAYIDGCSTVGVYKTVFLPLLAPVTATCCIRQGIGMWNDYLTCRSLLNGDRTPTLMCGVRNFFGAYRSDYGYAFCAILVSSLPMILMYIFLQKYFIKGMVAGAVKG